MDNRKIAIGKFHSGAGEILNKFLKFWFSDPKYRAPPVGKVKFQGKKSN